MPLKPGNDKKTVSTNIREFHTGKTYAHTKSKFGKKDADKQAIAVALSTARKYTKKADGGKTKKEKVPLPKPRPDLGPAYSKEYWANGRKPEGNFYNMDQPGWRDFHRSDNIEDRRDDPKGTVYPEGRPMGEILEDAIHTPDTGAITDALGAQDLEVQQNPHPTFDQRFRGQFDAREPTANDALFGALFNKGYDVFPTPSGHFAEGGSIEDEEAKQNLEAQGSIPMGKEYPAPADRDMGQGLSRWWYGDQPKGPDAQGNLPEVSMTEDPISRGISGVGKAFTAPGRAFNGEMKSEEILPEALNMAGVATGATSTSPIEGGLGTGIGRLSEGPHLGKLSQMEHMERVGMNPQTIYKQTGWYRGDDGMPRYWINDTGAKLKTENISSWDGKPFIEKAMPLEQVWDHPELYQAYPWLKNMLVKPMRHSEDVLAEYDPFTESVYMGQGDSMHGFHDTLHHEVVHAIQHHEGFANGGNLTQFLPKEYPNRTLAFQSKIQEFYGKLKERGLEFPGQISVDDLHHLTTAKLENLDPHDVMTRADLRQNGLLSDAHKIGREGMQLKKMRAKAYENYLHLAGESEARDAPYLRNNPEAVKPGEIPLHKNEALLPYRQIEPGKPMPVQRSSAYGGEQVLPEEFVPDGVYEPDPYAEKRGMKKGGKVKHPQIDENPQDHEFINFSKGGLIDSHIPGRTDKIPMKVRPGSYVLPADIPSALGEGNSKAGADILKKMFTHSAYGLPPPQNHSHEFRQPHSIVRFHKASGGKTDHVPIIAAGGEFIIHPDVVKILGNGDMKKGHKVLDKFVLHTRKQHIQTLKGLKPPR